jgi:hypothetical protein
VAAIAVRVVSDDVLVRVVSDDVLVRVVSDDVLVCVVSDDVLVASVSSPPEPPTQPASPATPATLARYARRLTPDPGWRFAREFHEPCEFPESRESTRRLEWLSPLTPRCTKRSRFNRSGSCASGSQPHEG